MKDLKTQELFNKVNRYRERPVSEELFTLLREGEETLEPEKADAYSMLLFYVGEAYFRVGNFEKALSYLSSYLQTPKIDEADIFLSEAYNILGIIFSTLNQPTIAKNYFLTAIENEQKQLHKTESSLEHLIRSYLNLGCLCRDAESYETAHKHFATALELLQKCTSKHIMDRYYVVTFAYLGQIYCMMGEFDKAMETNYILDIYQKLSDGSLYDNILCNFRIRLYDHIGNHDQFHKNFNILMQSQVTGCDFLDFFKNDINTCEYLIEKNYKEESRKLLDNLKQQTEELSLAYLDYHLQKVQVAYSKKFCGNKIQTKVYQVYQDLKARFNDYARTLQLESRETALPSMNMIYVKNDYKNQNKTLVYQQ